MVAHALPVASSPADERFADRERLPVSALLEERLDLSPRTARRMVRLARAEHAAPEVANAFRSGELNAMQAEAQLGGTGGETYRPGDVRLT